MGDDLKSLLLFKVSICFGPDEVSAICLSIYMLSLSFTPKLKESVHLFLGSSYVNGPVNCSIGHRVGGHWTQESTGGEKHSFRDDHFYCEQNQETGASKRSDNTSNTVLMPC